MEKKTNSAGSDPAARIARAFGTIASVLSPSSGNRLAQRSEGAMIDSSNGLVLMGDTPANTERIELTKADFGRCWIEHNARKNATMHLCIQGLQR